MNNIYTIIDIGSNSIKSRTGRFEKNKLIILRDETEVTRLAHGMNESKKLSFEKMSVSLRAISKMINHANSLGAENNIILVGTMALRTAENSNEFLKLVFEKTGFKIKVLSGEEEAYYSRLGAMDGFDEDKKNFVMFDSGGGSTEFVSKDGKITSVPVGAVSLSERFFYNHDNPVERKKFYEAEKFIEELFLKNKIQDFKPSENIIGVGGGVVAMAGVKMAHDIFMPSELHGTVLTKRDIIRQVELYASLTLLERENIIGLPPSRADVILGSACIVLCALRILEAISLTVSVNGLRHGLLLEQCKKFCDK